MLCPNCNKNEFNPWYSRDNGKPQKYPFKSCYACKQKSIEPQEQPQDNGKQDAAREMIELLGEIRDGILQLQSIEIDIKNILFSTVRVKSKGEIGKPFDAKKNENIPIVEETGEPEPEGGFPY